MTGRRDEIHRLEIKETDEHWLLAYGSAQRIIAGRWAWENGYGRVSYFPSEGEVRGAFQAVLTLHERLHEREEMFDRLLEEFKEELEPPPKPPPEEVIEEGALKRAIRELNIMDTVGGESE